MKQIKNTLLIALIAISINSYGQTVDKKNNISIGGGKESYNGDLGNAWFKSDEEWYGFVCFQYSHYLNRSFDMSASITFGDYGHCREKDESKFRSDGTVVLNMLSRLTSGVVSGKYKFANGYLLKEDAKIAPYIYIGAGINNVSNYWWENKNRVNKGNYTSLNGGFGLRYNCCEKFNFTYNLGFGYFTSDKIDYRSEGTNDMFMQHSIMFGINF